MFALLAASIVAAGQSFTCTPTHVWDGDGPVWCAEGPHIRIAGIAAREMDGTCRPNQPCVPGDPREQRRAMARVMGATVAREDASPLGQLWFAQPVALICFPTGTSHSRVTAWCHLPDGRDLSCEAIRAKVAVRWELYDPKGYLRGCE